MLVAFISVCLPVTSGDTALRGLRIIISEALNLNQKIIKNRLLIVVPLACLIIGIILWAKMNADSFSTVWRYFNFFNQLIAIPTFLYATVYLYKNKRNYLMTLIPAIFYIVVTSMFILNSNIGFNLSYQISGIIAFVLTVIFVIYFYQNKLKNSKENS